MDKKKIIIIIAVVLLIVVAVVLGLIFCKKDGNYNFVELRIDKTETAVQIGVPKDTDLKFKKNDENPYKGELISEEHGFRFEMILYNFTKERYEDKLEENRDALNFEELKYKNSRGFLYHSDNDYIKEAYIVTAENGNDYDVLYVKIARTRNYVSGIDKVAPKERVEPVLETIQSIKYVAPEETE